MPACLETYLTRPENCVLLLSARPKLEASQGALFRSQFGHNFDWEYLLTQLTRHNLLPLFLQHRHKYLSDLPGQVDVYLKSKTIPLLQHQLKLASELSEILDLLAKADLQTLAYKGPALAQMAYGSLALRPFQDLDLLVNPRELKPCLELLLANGYKLQEPHHGPERMEILLRRARQGYEVTMDPQKWLGAIDVHWRLMPPHFPLDLTFEELWQRRVSTGLGPNVFTFSREDTLLVHCVHCVKHGWKRLEWIAAMLTFLEPERQSNTDWDVLLARADQLGLRRLLLLGIQLALDLGGVGAENPVTGASLPPRLAEALNGDPAVSRLSIQIWQAIFGQGNGFEDRLSTLARFLMKTRERPSDRFRQAVGAGLTVIQVGPEDISPQDRSLLIPFVRRLQRRATP